MDDREHADYVHMYEICTHCGFRKAFVEYKDDDTGPVNWSGIEHWQACIIVGQLF